MKKIRVLIVDDEILFAQSLCLNLMETGEYEAFVVNDPLAAIDTARCINPDVLILDLIMPGMDGGQLRRRFLQDPELCDIPVILLTASKNWTSGMEIETGGDILLSKPVTLENLRRYLNVKATEHPSPPARHDEVRYAAVVI